MLTDAEIYELVKLNAKLVENTKLYNEYYEKLEKITYLFEVIKKDREEIKKRIEILESKNKGGE